jgi:RNA polymerase sigma-70 factor (ECF subfamily)
LIFREVEDRDLILKARRGDVDAYNVLVSRWERRVFSFIVRSIGDREEALDLSQDTFLKVYRGLRSLQEVERFPQWLFRIAHNETISWRRKKRPEPSEDSELERAAMPSTRRENAAELTAAVNQALGTLPEEQRQAVLLKVYQGFKFHEIAEITGVPVSTVKSRVYTGFEALKAVLAPSRSSA